MEVGNAAKKRVNGKLNIGTLTGNTTKSEYTNNAKLTTAKTNAIIAAGLLLTFALLRICVSSENINEPLLIAFNDIVKAKNWTTKNNPI